MIAFRLSQSVEHIIRKNINTLTQSVEHIKPFKHYIYGARTIGMWIIGMEDNWHAKYWHGGQ